MNIQDIADFLDLVKDPAKYERILKNLQDEQARLNAVIATVGKASELDSLRKKVEKERSSVEKDFQTKVQALEEEVERKFKVAADAQASADKLLEQANALLQEAQAKETSAVALVKSIDGRDKELRKQEEVVQSQQKHYEALITEYEEKVAKIRSVIN